MSRKFLFEFEDDTRSTVHLYNRDDSEEEDKKPIIVSFPHKVTPIELSSDEDDIPMDMRVRDRTTDKKRKPVVKEVETQTDHEIKDKDDDVANTKVTADVGIMVDVKELELNSVVLESNVVTPMTIEPDNSTVESTEISKEIYYQCETCSCYYLSLKKLQKHSVIQHDKMSALVKVFFNTHCKFCSSAYRLATYNQHIKNKHVEMFNKKRNTNKKGIFKGPFECTICKLKFLSYNEGKRHRKSHDNVGQKNILRRITQSHDSPTASEVVKNEKKIRNKLNTKPIPNNVLFQCPKCKLNFFTYRNGLRHRMSCEKVNAKCVIVNCSKCNKKFQSTHIMSHYKQHELTAHFEIQPVLDGIEHKIVYRCTKCNVCMEEPGCKLHFQNQCKTTCVSCPVCYYKIDHDFIAKHSNAHIQMGLLRDEIILVDVFN